MDISRAYLLYGSEEYLISRHKKRLLEALSVRPDDMNFSSFTGAGTDIAALSDAVGTMPFFAERRVVLVEDSELFTKASDPLLHILESIPETTVLIFVEKNVDARLSTFKYIKKNHTATEYKMLTGAELEKWAIGERLGGAGLRIKRDAWQTFLSITTADEKMKNMTYMDNELEKLISYCYGRDTVEVGDVRAVTSGYADDDIFSLLDAIAAGNIDTVMRRYNDLLLTEKDPGEILRMIIWEFRRIYQAGELYNEGMSVSDVASRTRMRDWQVKKHISAGHFKSFPPARAFFAIEKATETLYAIRRGNMDEKIGAELLMIELTSKQQP